METSGVKTTGYIILIVVVLKVITGSLWPDFEPGLGLLAIIWIPLIAIVVIAAVMFWQDASNTPVDTPGDRKDGRRDP